MPQETERTELNVGTAALGCPRGATRAGLPAALTKLCVNAQERYCVNV
jgi:hypothetical protein